MQAEAVFLDTSTLLRASLVRAPFYLQVHQAPFSRPSASWSVEWLAHPESVAALTQRQHRDHAAWLGARQVALLLRSFERDWATFYVVPPDEALAWIQAGVTNSSPCTTGSANKRLHAVKRGQPRSLDPDRRRSAQGRTFTSIPAPVFLLTPDEKPGVSVSDVVNDRSRGGPTLRPRLLSVYYRPNQGDLCDHRC